MHRNAVALLMVAGLVLGTPQAGFAQAPARTAQVELQQNYPNPFNPATTIPFRLDASLFANGHRPVVTLRIYNVLAHVLAGQIHRNVKGLREVTVWLTSQPTTRMACPVGWSTPKLVRKSYQL